VCRPQVRGAAVRRRAVVLLGKQRTVAAVTDWEERQEGVDSHSEVPLAITRFAAVAGGLNVRIQSDRAVQQQWTSTSLNRRRQRCLNEV